MKLSLFLSGVSVLSSNFDPDSLDANGISTDSRTVRPGELFICLDGTSFDGADYISEASAARQARAGRCPLSRSRIDTLLRRADMEQLLFPPRRRHEYNRRYGDERQDHDLVHP